MYIKRHIFFVISIILFNISVVFSIRKYGKEDLKLLRDEVKMMFDHAYSGYIKYAYPYDELRPLTCDGIDTWGSYSLTLIDALDTLAVMGNFTEFRRVADIVTAKADFDANINVSVFETNIRIVGGLLSAHLLSHKAGMDLEPGWPCNGPLLRLAEDVARRLLPAFDTKTGMPYGTVNLRYGVPPGETSITCTAGVGTYIIEFGTLSRLTGDPVYEEVALHALHSLFEHRSSIGLFGNHLDVETGRWTAQDSGIGAGVDSFFEYLVKGSILFGRPELRAMFEVARLPIEKYLNKNHWYVWASMTKGQVTLPVFQSLEAYWPGVLALIGDVENAVKTLVNYRAVWKQLGFTPEFYNIGQGEAGQSRESYPLRPELAESAVLLYRVTKDPAILDIGKDILTSIQHSAKTKCGYATIKDARDHTQDNRMESFFLAETTKYLYLLFDTDNFIHNDGGYGTVHSLPSGRQCIIDSGGYIFNTEAHPIDPGALQCCYDWELQTNAGGLSESFKGDNIDFHFSPKEKSSSSMDLNGESKSALPSALDDLNETLPQQKISDFEKKKAENLAKLNSDLKQLNKDMDRILKIVLETKNNGTEYNDSNDINQEMLSTEHEPSFSKDSSTPSPATAWDNDSHPGHITEITGEDDKSTNEMEPPPEVSEVTSLSRYIQELVGSRPSKENFDPQQLLEKIRAKRRPIKETSFELLTCPARSVLSRVTIATQFYN